MGSTTLSFLTSQSVTWDLAVSLAQERSALAQLRAEAKNLVMLRVVAYLREQDSDMNSRVLSALETLVGVLVITMLLGVLVITMLLGVVSIPMLLEPTMKTNLMIWPMIGDLALQWFWVSAISHRHA